MKNKTILINLFGGPGSGKSTTAAEIFSHYKHKGINIELVREEAKNWAYENRKIQHYHQFELLTTQFIHHARLYEKVDIIVTDSPLILSPIYEERYFNTTYTSRILNIMNEYYKDVIVLNFILNRSKPYNPSGRFESEDAAKFMDIYIKDYLRNNNICFYELDGDYSNQLNNIINKTNINLINIPFSTVIKGSN